MPPAADPEPVQIGVQIGVRVRCTDPEILVQRLPGAAAERQSALAVTLADHPYHVVLEVDVLDSQAGDLRPAAAGLRQQQDRARSRRASKCFAADRQQPVCPSWPAIPCR
jgi:hypothetical protein